MDIHGASIPENLDNELTRLFEAMQVAYSSALLEIGSCSVEVCPALGDDLQKKLEKLEYKLHTMLSSEDMQGMGSEVAEKLKDWSKRVAKHYKSKAEEVKELLVLMATASEAIGEKDKRCYESIEDATATFEQIATLDDLTLMRACIRRSANELKDTIATITAEGQQTLDMLRKELSKSNNKIEEVRYSATLDELTGLRTRKYVESQVQQRIDCGLPISLILVDIDNFKLVNDKNGHLVGDDLLRQFAKSLQSVCRSTDVLGRWGGDEFIILLDCCGTQAVTQLERMSKRISNEFTVIGKHGPLFLRLKASFGLAEHVQGETMLELFERADVEMYRVKAMSLVNPQDAKRESGKQEQAA